MARNTPTSIYINRRHFITSALGLLGSVGARSSETKPFSNDKLTPLKLISSYNNFYEYSTDKKAVKHLAKEFNSQPWEISIEGEVKQKVKINIDELISSYPSKEFIYRFRCVEGWSMVVPWLGFQLSNLLRDVQPTNDAKFVSFESIYRPSEMIGQRHATMDWPYREALRLDEALHPLTILATGLYNSPLPNQNGAPLRLVVPWKYGYKSIKAISIIRLSKSKPKTTWSQLVPSEYGFYGNVVPTASHPRWSQKREVRLGESRKRKTLFLNGYGDDLEGMYTNQELMML